MRRRVRSGWNVLAMAAVTVLVMGAAIGHADDAGEIEGLKRQIETLRRSDAEKTRQLEELKRMVETLVAREPAKPAPGAAAPPPAAVAAPPLTPPVAAAPTGESAIDRAIRGAEAAAGVRPTTTGTPAKAPTAAAGALATTASGPAALDDQLRDLARQGTPVVTGSASERSARGLGLTEQPSLFARRIGQAEVRLLDLSMDVLSVAGWSTADDTEISALEGGAHDPKRRGFTLQQAEFSLTGAVDPYFTGEVHIVATTGGLELEEAFLTTTRLPIGLQIEAGYFFTEFGRINPLHPHAWTWIDQPVILSRIFGGEGLRTTGARFGWLLPTPWFTEAHFGVQNANDGELTTSFLNGEEAIGGRPAVKTRTSNLSDLLYLTRLNTSYDFSDSLTGILGASGLFGPNSSGDDARTFVYGVDLTMKWQPANSQRGWPFLTWQTEVMKRDYTADHFLAGTAAGNDGGGHDHAHGGEEPEEEDDDAFTEDIPGALLRDWGMYTQLTWGFRWQWAAGLRYEYAGGSGASLPDGRGADFVRADRHRFSPLLLWQPSEFSRFRLQYNFDHANGTPLDDAHSVWFGMEILYGSHPAHTY